jgi:hypothetical protein
MTFLFEQYGLELHHLVIQSATGTVIAKASVEIVLPRPQAYYRMLVGRL